MRSASLRAPATLFITSSLLVIGACFAVVRSQAFAMNREVGAWGVTFDLTITIPLLYWFFVVRPRHARPLTIAPVFVAGTILATFLVPRTEQQFLLSLRTLVVPAAEILLLGALAQRALRARREWPSEGDAYTRIHAAARALAGEGRAAEVIASEAALFYYAIFGWTKKPADDDGRSFTIHERCGWPSIVAAIIVMIVAESIAMHLLLRRWSPAAAWAWTGRKDVLKLAMIDEPRWLITFREPVVCNGLAGIQKTIRAIALLSDDDGVVTSLRRARAAAGECAPLP